MGKSNSQYWKEENIVEGQWLYEKILLNKWNQTKSESDINTIPSSLKANLTDSASYQGIEELVEYDDGMGRERRKCLKISFLAKTFTAYLFP